MGNTLHSKTMAGVVSAPKVVCKQQCAVCVALTQKSHRRATFLVKFQESV